MERPSAEAKLFTFLRVKLVLDADKSYEILKQNGNQYDLLTEAERLALQFAPFNSGIRGGRDDNGVVTLRYTPVKNESKVLIKTANGKVFVILNIMAIDTIAHLTLSLPGIFMNP